MREQIRCYNRFKSKFTGKGVYNYVGVNKCKNGHQEIINYTAIVLFFNIFSDFLNSSNNVKVKNTLKSAIDRNFHYIFSHFNITTL